MQDEPDIKSLEAELNDKKAMLADLDAGKIVLPSEQLTKLQKRVAALETHIKQIRADRTKEKSALPN